MAQGSEVIEIEIVLEDGQVKKGFIDLQKSAQQFKGSVETNVGGAVSKSAGEATDALGALKNSFAGLSRGFAVGGAVVAGVVATAYAAFEGLNKIAEQSKIAEEIRAINAQFDALAGGLSGNLKASFTETARGLIDLDDILKAANQTMGNLDISAQTLADNLKIARQASVAFGADTTQAFEALNQAIITGSTRQLRQLGIFIDSKKAIDDYAKSIGVSAQFLNEAGRQQAIANAIAEQSRTVFKGVNADQEKNSDGAQKLKVSWGEFKEAIAAFIDVTSGPSALKTQSWFASILDGLKETISPSGPQTGVEQLQKIQNQIEDTNDKLKESIMFWNDVKGTVEEIGQGQEAKRLIDVYTGQLQRLRAEEEKLVELQMHRAQAEGNLKGSAEEQMQAARASQVERERLAQQQMQLENQLLATQMSNAQTNMSMAKTQDQFDAAKKEEQRIRAEQHKNALENIDKQYRDAGLLGTQQYDAAVLAEEEKFKNDKIKIAEQENASMLKLRGIVQAGIVNGLTNAFAGLGKALVKGQNGFEAFGKAVLSALGAMAIQIGTMLVSIGLGFQALGPVLPVFGLSGAAAVAAGLGLIVLGGVLSALGEGGETGAGTATAGGGGVTGGAGGAPNLATGVDQTELQRAAPGSQIAVNINGNVFDRRQTGLEIVEIIKEQFDTQGGQTIVGLG